MVVCPTPPLSAIATHTRRLNEHTTKRDEHAPRQDEHLWGGNEQARTEHEHRY